MEQLRARSGRTVRWTACATAATMLVSCSAGPDSPPAEVDPPRPAVASPSDRARPLPETTVTALEGPAAMASRVAEAVRLLRDASAPAEDVRRAGEDLQLAARDLAEADPRLERAVTRGLEPAAARVLRPSVRAARELRAMTEPQTRLPEWRIVAPPAPRRLLAHYRAAQRSTGVPWRYLAAIHLVETRMGRIRGTSSAGAEGPMQFLPSTWELYGGSGDIDDPRDAVLAAARLLRANGAPADLPGALWHYNPSDRYVRAVSAYAETVRRDPWVYRGYWHWRVLYRHVRGTYVLPVGYPRVRAGLLPEG